MSMKQKITYSNMDPVSHVLKRPDTYVGSTKVIKRDHFVCSCEGEDNKIMCKEIQYIPAMLRIFVEVLSNAIDNKWRSEQFNIKQTYINVSVTKKLEKLPL